MANETQLILTGMGVPPYSARGLTQSLDPIGAAANLRRTINGALIDVSSAQFRKYRSTISGNDQQPPAIDAIWPGLQLTVSCIAELGFLTGGTAGRTAVAGSTRTEGSFTFYRPQLLMLVTNFTVTKDEYGALQSWSLECEES